MKYLILLLFAGCTTVAAKPATYEDRCGIHQVILEYQQKWLPEDAVRIPEFRQGCVERFGQRSCLRKVTKVRTQGYTVVCGPER